MTVYELIKSFDKKCIIEELLLGHPYLFFPVYIDSYHYYETGIENILANDYKENDAVVNVETISTTPTCIVTYPGNSERYGFDCGDWDKMLGMQVGDCMSAYSEGFVVATLVKELLFFGNSRKQVYKRTAEITRSLKEQAKNPPDGIPAEEFFEKMRALLKDIPPEPEVGEVYKNINGDEYTVIAIGKDLSRERTMVCLMGATDTLMLSVDEMFFDLDGVKFPDGRNRRYRFERV